MYKKLLVKLLYNKFGLAFQNTILQLLYRKRLLLCLLGFATLLHRHYYVTVNT